MVTRGQPYERYIPAQQRILVCEGVDEKNVFSSLLASMGLGEIQVIPIGGKTQLTNGLRWLDSRPEFRDVSSLGIVRDADNDADAAFESVTSVLKSENLPVPLEPLAPIGTRPKVTVMILPGDGRPGSLEDLLYASVSLKLEASCVEEYINCLKKRVSDYDLTPGNLAKAKIHTYLASQHDPDKRPGEAAEAGFWPWDSTAFNQLKQFLRSL